MAKARVIPTKARRDSMVTPTAAVNTVGMNPMMKEAHGYGPATVQTTGGHPPDLVKQAMNWLHSVMHGH